MKNFNKTWDTIQKAVAKAETVSCAAQNDYTRVSANVIKRKK